MCNDFESIWWIWNGILKQHLKFDRINEIRFHRMIWLSFMLMFNAICSKIDMNIPKSKWIFIPILSKQKPLKFICELFSGFCNHYYSHKGKR